MTASASLASPLQAIKSSNFCARILAKATSPPTALNSRSNILSICDSSRPMVRTQSNKRTNAQTWWFYLSNNPHRCKLLVCSVPHATTSSRTVRCDNQPSRAISWAYGAFHVPQHHGNLMPNGTSCAAHLVRSGWLWFWVCKTLMHDYKWRALGRSVGL